MDTPPKRKRAPIGDAPSKLRHGITRKQRHTTLQLMIDAITGCEACPPVNEVDAYVMRLEQRVYDGYFGADLPVVYNVYRGELYKQRCLDLVWNMRRSGPWLMQRYEPEMLAAVPSHLLARGTEAGAFYDQWVHKRQEMDRRERELREARAAEQGEGWLRCPKCGGKFAMTMLQMRSADEPATIFLTCQRCNFIKRKS